MRIICPFLFSIAFALGIWGPYKNALLPGFYLHEGGQSSTGYLLDYIVKNHPAYDRARECAGKMYGIHVVNIYDEFLSRHLITLLS